MTNDFLLVTVTVVLLPLVPAYILFRFLPSEAGVEGPYSGLSLKLKGAFGGYFVVLLAVMTFFHTIPPDRGKIWTIKGRLVGAQVDNTGDLRITNHEEPDVTSDLAFKRRIVVTPGPNGEPDWPDLSIDDPSHNTYWPVTIHLDGTKQPCTVTKNKDEVEIAGDCLKLVKKTDKAPAYVTSVAPISN